ncbi:MAG: response regulator, partial [Rhizobacter sp.]
RIFDAFHQADSSFTRRFGGTGLGLTIARELARAMGGDLVCTSQQGRGSCFTVTMDLPAVPDPTPIVAQESLEQTPLHGRVLLAEDNPVNALVAEAVRKNLGLTVELVEDGLQAVASFRASPPDLVLLDCQMPVMDGFEAVRRIREHEGEQGLARTPVVALTANALQGDREHSLAAGMDDHLAKPFRDEDLRAILRRHLVPA